MFSSTRWSAEAAAIALFGSNTENGGQPAQAEFAFVAPGYPSVVPLRGGSVLLQRDNQLDALSSTLEIVRTRQFPIDGVHPGTWRLVTSPNGENLIAAGSNDEGAVTYKLNPLTLESPRPALSQVLPWAVFDDGTIVGTFFDTGEPGGTRNGETKAFPCDHCGYKDPYAFVGHSMMLWTFQDPWRLELTDLENRRIAVIADEAHDVPPSIWEIGASRGTHKFVYWVTDVGRGVSYVRIYDGAQKKKIFELPIYWSWFPFGEYRDPPSHVALSPDGRRLALIVKSELRMYAVP